MPLFRANGQLCLFAHVPKCAGQSVEAHLRARFGPLALLDDKFHALRPLHRPMRCSPQHLTVEHLGRIVPLEWIEHSFAVVRHPIGRFVSAYNYVVANSDNISAGMGPEEWFERSVRLAKYEPFHNDNHLRPADELVPEGAAVFRLEDGLEQVGVYLDETFGPSDAASGFGHRNVSDKETTEIREGDRLSEAFAARLFDYYGRDFERFGYSQALPDRLKLLKPAAGRGRAHRRGLSDYLPPRMKWAARMALARVMQ